MIWGLSLHGWEDVMRVSLIIVGVSGSIAGLATWFVVKLQRTEIMQSEIALEKYKEDTKVKVEEAKNQGIEAGKTAGDALVRAAALEKDAAQSKERAAKLELELAKIKQPRLIPEEKLKPLAKKLESFSSTPFDLAIIPGDPEAAIFGVTIATVLETAGWKWVAWAPEGAPFQQVFTITGTDKPNIGQFGFFDVTIFLRPDDPDMLATPLQAVMDLLKEEGFAVGFEASTNPNINNKATIHITVGKKR